MMVKVNKRPIVIQDLIEQATYIAQNNLDASDRFLMAAEETFNFLGKMPAIGKLGSFIILTWLMFVNTPLRDSKIIWCSTV